MKYVISVDGGTTWEADGYEIAPRTGILTFYNEQPDYTRWIGKIRVPSASFWPGQLQWIMTEDEFKKWKDDK